MLFIFIVFIKLSLEQDNPALSAIPCVQALLLQVPDLKRELRPLSKPPLLPHNDFSLRPTVAVDPGGIRRVPRCLIRAAGCRRALLPLSTSPREHQALRDGFPALKKQGLPSGNVPPPRHSSA